MNWEPQTSHKIRLSRAEMLDQIRRYFSKENVLEVETPALSMAGNTDSFIESFQCFTGSTSSYLHTSPEYPMKRLLAAGSGDIYQICKAWRKGETGDKHNPEFTLLEWYRLGFSYKKLMREVDDLLRTLIKEIKSSRSLTYAELFLEKFALNPHIATQDELASCVNNNINGLSTDGLNSQALLDVLVTHCIEPEFKENQLTFIYDYPASQSALAALKVENDYSVAQRFEVYLGSMELANGYQEETSYERNKQILKSEHKARIKAGLETVPEDKLFLDACKAGIPYTSGVAIGLDRVLMCITGEKSIQKVINFPWDKA